jgi:hypothetical protein
MQHISDRVYEAQGYFARTSYHVFKKRHTSVDIGSLLALTVFIVIAGVDRCKCTMAWFKSIQSCSLMAQKLV